MRGAQLDRFFQEVIAHGAEALLPQHLSDTWLAALLEEAEILQNEEQGEEQSCPGLLAAVLTLLNHLRGHPLETQGELALEVERLWISLRCYISCLAIEEVSRETDIRGEPPTLDNIFDEQRLIRFTRDDPLTH